jgi:hypothetical protein
MLSRRAVIAGAIEAVEGVAEAITVADGGVMAINVKWDPDFDMEKREDVMSESLSPLQPLVGAKKGTLTFQLELKGAGTAYAALVKPACGKYLRACGFAETIVTTAGVETATYEPASTGVPSITLWFYHDGVVKKLYGCRGNAKLSAKKGKRFLIDFSFQGVYGGIADLAIISPTYEPTAPPLFLNASLTIGAYAAVVDSFDADMGNTLEVLGSVNNVTGYRVCNITKRYPVGKLDPEMTLKATHDWYGLWEAGTPAALNIGPIVGEGDYNTFAITAPKMVTTKIGEGDRGGQQVANHDYTFVRDTGDDEFVLTFSK